MKAVFNWSGGKDSMLALHRILREKEYDVKCLLTSVNAAHQRITMHGVRLKLLQTQASAIGLSLKLIEMPETPDMNTYEALMEKTWKELKSQGISHSIFGDIYLEDLRKYREDQLSALNVKTVFPLWKQPVEKLIGEFLGLGYKAIVTCVNEKHLDKSFAGRIIDEDFIKDLPAGVDVCGENGEFHTFVFDGPLFKSPVKFETGETVYRKYDSAGADNGFWFTDLIPVR